MLADADNRPASEMLWVMVRWSMYGIVGRVGADVEMHTRKLGEAVTCELLQPSVSWHVLRTNPSGASSATDRANSTPVTSEATHA